MPNSAGYKMRGGRREGLVPQRGMLVVVVQLQMLLMVLLLRLEVSYGEHMNCARAWRIATRQKRVLSLHGRTKGQGANKTARADRTAMLGRPVCTVRATDRRAGRRLAHGWRRANCTEDGGSPFKRAALPARRRKRETGVEGVDRPCRYLAGCSGIRTCVGWNQVRRCGVGCAAEPLSIVVVSRCAAGEGRGRLQQKKYEDVPGYQIRAGCSAMSLGRRLQLPAKYEGTFSCLSYWWKSMYSASR